MHVAHDAALGAPGPLPLGPCACWGPALGPPGRAGGGDRRPLVWGCRLGALGCHRGRLSAPGLTKLKPLTSQPGGPSMVGLAPFRIPARSANHSFLARSANGWALHRRHVCGYKRSILVLCMGGVQAPHGPPPPFLLHARVRCKRALGVNSKCGAPIYINFLFRLIYESNILMPHPPVTSETDERLVETFDRKRGSLKLLRGNSYLSG